MVASQDRSALCSRGKVFHRTNVNRYKNLTLINTSGSSLLQRAWNIAAKVVFGVGTGIIEWASPSALELLGYDGTDLAGRSILDLMPPSVSCIHRAAWTSGASSELVDTFAPCMFARPVRMLRADGTAVVVKLDLNLETISDGSPSAVASDDRSWGDAHGSTESPQQRAPALEVTLRECTAGEEDRESTMAVVVDSFTGEILSLVDSMAFGLPEDVVQRKGPGARRFSISALVRMNGRAATLTRTWAQHGAPPTGCMVLSGTGTFVPAFLSAKPASGTAKLTVFLTRADLVRAVATVTRGSQVDMIDVSPPCLSVEDEGDMALRLYDVLPWLSPAARLSDVVRRAVAERPGGPTAGDKVEGVCAVLPGFGTVPCAVQAFTRGASAEEGYVLIVLQPGESKPKGILRSVRLTAHHD